MLSKRIFALSILALFVVVAIFGLRASMVMDKDGNMSTCPLMNGMSSICRMNVFEHIGKWQSLFTITVPTVILLLFALTLLFVGSSFKNFDKADSLKEEKFLYYQRQNFILQLFDYLHLAFSKGILHPKIYAPSR